MKDNIHPKYVVTKVTCGCGNTFVTRSTQAELKVDICNACHPFYTGKLKYVDTAGRIEKFQKKFAATGYASLNRGKKAAAAAGRRRRQRGVSVACRELSASGCGESAIACGRGCGRLPDACRCRLATCLAAIR